MKKLTKVIGILILICLGLGLLLPAIFSSLGYNFYVLPPSLERLGRDGINKMDKFGIYSSTSQWTAAKTSYLDKVKAIESEKDLVKLLNDAAKIAGGKHSAAFTLQTEEEREKSYIEPSIKRQGDLVYIKVPEFVSTSEREEAYANKISAALEGGQIKKVIVDLRDNPGGSMYPMLLGLSPLFPDGRIFSLVDKNNKETLTIDLENGKIKSYHGLEVSNKNKLTDTKIAVLIGPNTGSSGEATLLAFKGLENVRTFGTDTAGYLSVNQSFPLWENIMLNLTVGFFKDRQGNIYGEESLSPDLVTEDPYQAAIDWLN
ncbi:S41 family peptidase [Neofamilia massiliensis]|uniref:S41 family peptidase n=1 Tax=Neofamilia massiliensis TaxID=1673724 RepID=UPI0006BB95DC|nr:S41 family peptidase [Neofamilia massiliensis]